MTYNYVILYKNQPFIIVTWSRPIKDDKELLEWYSEKYAIKLEYLSLLNNESIMHIIKE